MLALLSENILWWHWIVAGLVLLIIEMNIGTFIFLGLGLAAVIVGIVDFFADTAFTTEIVIWTILSIIALIAWKTWFKEQTISNIGQSNHSFDTQGTVTGTILPHQRGKVQFDAPVLGNSTWHATANEKIEKGSRVSITEVNGQIIEVTKTDSQQ
jgi:membrane protein implicated in regulation of membrane protease activity